MSYPYQHTEEEDTTIPQEDPIISGQKITIHMVGTTTVVIEEGALIRIS
ncbi:13437_t:CDS:2 [Funneliformis caledonium]|uniref:13437_t:CDS:1 n=1 Tax=Funneliformis caledonium TaxID=1117310 RepID=A0A9N9AWW9_9GLOM|nr:13437_t:CDS:2 [Funneliformis caledonium]